MTSHKNRFLRAGARLLLSLLPFSLLVPGCAMLSSPNRARDRLPPVTREKTGQWQPGRFVWLDLITPDAEAAKKFYGGLLGWQFRNEHGYTVILNRQRPIGGIIELKPEKSEKPAVAAQWLASLSVDNIDRAVAWTKEAGGRLLNGPVEMKQRGYGALISDPGGAKLVLLRAKNGDPPERKPDIGDWLWIEDWTLEPERTALFYRRLGGYENTLASDDYIVLLNQGRWRAGIRRIRKKRFSGRWVPTIRVEDAGTLARRTRELGGLVLLKPGDSPQSPDTALIIDNCGALLILQPWKFDSEEGKP